MPSRSDAANPKNPLLKIKTSSPELRGFGKGMGTPANSSLDGFSHVSAAGGKEKANNNPKNFGSVSSANGKESDESTECFTGKDDVSAAGGMPKDSKLGGFADCNPSDMPGDYK